MLRIAEFDLNDKKFKAGVKNKKIRSKLSCLTLFFFNLIGFKEASPFNALFEK